MKVAILYNMTALEVDDELEIGDTVKDDEGIEREIMSFWESEEKG